MYARRQVRPKPRKSQIKQFPAPIAGWISNRALATPYGNEGKQPQGAMILDNFIPRSTTVQMRSGKVRYATVDGDADTLFTYNNGTNKRLFATSSTTIFDITNVQNAENLLLVDEHGDYLVTEDAYVLGYESTVDYAVMDGFGGGDWITVQFATTGGVYRIGVNGVNEGFIYDGSQFFPYTTGGISSADISGIVTPFVKGEIVTGQSSGATAMFWAEDGGTAYFYNLSPQVFTAGETIEGSIAGEAILDTVPMLYMGGPTFENGKTTADMSFVWVYRNRLYFAERDSMNAYYIENVDSVGGDALVFPLGGVFDLGGSLMIGQRWALSSGDSGGLSDQCVFISDEGQVAVYQGGSPSDVGPAFSDPWAIQGVYRIGRPLGKRAFIRGAGDLAIGTSVGLIPLSKAIELDLTALTVASISYPIADAWYSAMSANGRNGWQAEIWPEEKIAVFCPPIGSITPFMFVANTETGAWARFTGWDGRCMTVFNGQLYFGSTGGGIFIANDGGTDDGATYTASLLPLYDDMNLPGTLKIGKLGRYLLRATGDVQGQVRFQSNFNTTLPPEPDAETSALSGGVWGTSEWGAATWGGGIPDTFTHRWNSVGGTGYSISLSLQVTSGSPQPLLMEVISGELVYDSAEIVT